MKPNRLNRFSLLCSLICYLIVCCPPTLTAQQQPREVVRILAVGNSFSDDGVEYLDELAKSRRHPADRREPLHRGAARWSATGENVSKGLPAYDYRKNCEGVQSNTPKTSLLSALQDEPWDYITVQQVSQNSGLYDTYYPFMPSLLQYLRTHATNPGVRFAIHQVWAYACDSNHSGFANYDNNQSRMYREIVKTVNRVARKEHIPIVIPSGTAIQTGRNLMGDRMTRDGFHLDYGLGRYIAACTWYETFFRAGRRQSVPSRKRIAPGSRIGPTYRTHGPATSRRAGCPEMTQASQASPDKGGHTTAGKDPDTKRKAFP